MSAKHINPAAQAFRLTCMVILGVAFFSIRAAALPSYLPASKIVPGMKGYGLTVFQGTKISRFPVEVISVIPNDGPGGDSLILVRVSGPDIENSGGIALGMSGSPVYFNGKLAGAVSVTFPQTDHMIGGVTPIEYMFRVGSYKRRVETRRLTKPIRVGNRTYKSIEFTDSHSKDALYAKYAMAPVAISGVSERSFRILKKHFASMGIDTLPRNYVIAGAMPRATSTAAVQTTAPGSAVAIQLARGPVDISAVGTVTAVDGDRVYAFGHPLFHRGAIDFIMADAYVHATVPGSDMPFKIASPGKIRGAFEEDRGSAVVGRLKAQAKLIPFDIEINDADTGQKGSFHVEIVKDPDLVRDLAVTALLQVCDKVIDRVGPGTSHIEFTVDTRGYEKPVTRTNMFFSDFDISAQGLAEIIDALDIITANKLKNTEVTGIKAKVTFDSSRSVASIEKAEIAASAATATSFAPVPETELKTGLAQAPSPAEIAVAASQDKIAPKDEERPPRSGKWKRQKLYPISESAGQKLDGADSAATDSGQKNMVVERGQKVALRVTIRPYRADPINDTLYLRVPDDIALGDAIINVFSGTKFLSPIEPDKLVIDIDVETLKPREKGQPAGEEKKTKTIDDILENFMSRDLNNEIVATITSLAFPIESDKDLNAADGAAPTRDRAKKRTDWVLDGSAMIHVRVEDSKDPATINIRRSKINSLKDAKKPER